MHAYPDDDLGPVRLGVVANDCELLIHVSDHGGGFQESSPNAGLGLGLPLMAKLSDSFVVRERDFGGVEVDLRFVIRAS